MAEMAALTIEAHFQDVGADALTRIADDVMAFLLMQDRIQDPSVALDISVGMIEVEMLIPNATTLNAAKAIGEPIFKAAMDHAQVSIEVDENATTMELVPA